MSPTSAWGALPAVAAYPHLSDGPPPGTRGRSILSLFPHHAFWDTVAPSFFLLSHNSLCLQALRAHKNLWDRAVSTSATHRASRTVTLPPPLACGVAGLVCELGE